jgi:hypothetical protein
MDVGQRRTFRSKDIFRAQPNQPAMARLGQHWGWPELRADPAKIAALNASEIPIYEPGLNDLVHTNVRQASLSFTTNLSEAVIGADVASLPSAHLRGAATAIIEADENTLTRKSALLLFYTAVLPIGFWDQSAIRQ